MLLWFHILQTFSDAQTGSSPCVTNRTSHFWWAPDLGIPLIETYYQNTTGACDFPPVEFTRFYTGQTSYESNCPDEYELPIVWRDNFECHAPFAIDNIEGWTAIDGEGGTTWGASDVDFTNENYVGSGIVWNQSSSCSCRMLAGNDSMDTHLMKEIKVYISLHLAQGEHRFQMMIG